VEARVEVELVGGRIAGGHYVCMGLAEVSPEGQARAGVLVRRNGPGMVAVVPIHAGAAGLPELAVGPGAIPDGSKVVELLALAGQADRLPKVGPAQFSRHRENWQGPTKEDQAPQQRF